MFRVLKLKVKHTVYAIIIITFLLIYFGAFTHFFEIDFETSFHYPYDGDIEEFVQQLRLKQEPRVAPINSYNYRYTLNCADKCKELSGLRLVFIVKSAPMNFKNRVAIRSTWGYERRFSDVEIRTAFLIGETSPELQRKIELEARHHRDIIQGNFSDNYFNNTLKTMMGFHWAVNYCANSRFYMFVDDDYYVSTKNVLRFIRNPVNYPEYLKVKPFQRKLSQYDIDLKDDVRLYSGYTFKSAPLRHYSSKWYVSLEEYPYDMWPPYVTAGAYILSHEALFDMFYASYYTKHFRFDDIYVGLLAYKAKIKPYHSEQFHFYKLNYNPKIYEFVVATHGFHDPEELLKVWTEQRSLGNA